MIMNNLLVQIMNNLLMYRLVFVLAELHVQLAEISELRVRQVPALWADHVTSRPGIPKFQLLGDRDRSRQIQTRDTSQHERSLSQGRGGKKALLDADTGADRGRRDRVFQFTFQ